MWNKAIIGCLASLALATCGPLTDVETMSDDVSSVSEIKPSTTSDQNRIKTGETPIGMVPKKTPSMTASKQVRLTDYLMKHAENVKFAADTIPVSESVMRQLPGLPAMIPTTKIQSGLHLVIDNIQPLQNSPASAVTKFECDGGSFYRAYAAASPSLYTSIATEAGYATEAAIPYGLIICDQGDDFDVLALSISHQIFKNDAVKNDVLKTLPADHPLFKLK